MRGDHLGDEGNVIRTDAGRIAAAMRVRFKALGAPKPSEEARDAGFADAKALGNFSIRAFARQVRLDDAAAQIDR